jgi:hypothetical protein
LNVYRVLSIILGTSHLVLIKFQRFFARLVAYYQDTTKLPFVFTHLGSGFLLAGQGSSFLTHPTNLN